jgi:molybdate transport system substrate-binding protein
LSSWDGLFDDEELRVVWTCLNAFENSIAVLPSQGANRTLYNRPPHEEAGEKQMAELKVLSAGAVKSGVAKLARAYADESGAEVKVEFATAPEVRRRMSGGEEADVVVAPPTVMDDLADAGIIVTQSRAFLGRSRMGIVVHAQAPVREVLDVSALKRLLSTAKAVVHNKASSGAYAVKLLHDLGVAEGLGSRVVVVDSGSDVMKYVGTNAPGTVGLAQISEIRVIVAKEELPIRFLGPLPDAVQNVTSYEAAAVVGREEEAAAKALARYMATPDAAAVFAATGID